MARTSLSQLLQKVFDGEKMKLKQSSAAEFQQKLGYSVWDGRSRVTMKITFQSVY